MLVSSKELYRASREKNFAFPAANFVDQLSASAHIAAAEKLGLAEKADFNPRRCGIPHLKELPFAER